MTKDRFEMGVPGVGRGNGNHITHKDGRGAYAKAMEGNYSNIPPRAVPECQGNHVRDSSTSPVTSKKISIFQSIWNALKKAPK